MSISQAVISGVVQGITEFFPISSSGHLVLVHSIFGIEEPQIAFDIFLHAGTLASVFIFFRKEIIALFDGGRREFFLIVAASIPTFAIAMAFKETIERFFAMPLCVSAMLILTGIWLIAASLVVSLRRSAAKKEPGLVSALVIGVAQGISVIPGISRSGATIATGMLAGIEKESAVRFSFLLSIPAILGASILKAGKIAQGLSGAEALSFVAGGVTALITGILAIKALLALVKKDLFYLFGIYCIAAGALGLVLILR
jgi:undecaprenyl-diphosphatase